MSRVPASAGKMGAIGPAAYRTRGQECYVRYVATKSRRRQTADAGDLSATLSPAQVADELGVDERTVRRWVTGGVVPSESTPAGHHLLSPAVLQLLQQLARDKVPLNARTLRGRFNQEVAPQPDS
jgi:hypothetical protein